MYDIYDNDFDRAFDEAVDAMEKKEHRLIWADDLKACKFKNDISYNAFKNLIDRQPTVEAEPRKHGRWIEDEYGIPHCSECGTMNNTVYKNYCPNCGARMDGGENG